jgi:hypothetical protein
MLHIITATLAPKVGLDLFIYVYVVICLCRDLFICLCRDLSWSDLCTIYNMSGRDVSDIQTRAEGENLYIRYNTDANVVNGLKNDSSYEFIGEVILKINVV